MSKPNVNEQYAALQPEQKCLILSILTELRLIQNHHVPSVEEMKTAFSKAGTLEAFAMDAYSAYLLGDFNFGR